MRRGRGLRRPAAPVGAPPAPSPPLQREFLSLLPRALERVDPELARDYVARLPGRLERLAGEAAGRGPGTAAEGERDAARRLVAAIEGDWHDGDENLVRGWLDRWRGDDDRAAAARALLAAVAALERIRPGPGTLRFFLWEMESVLAGLAEPGRARRRRRAFRRRGGPC